MKVQFTYLYRFCDYFILDWQNTFDSANDVVDFFIQTSKPSDQLGLVDDITRALAEIQNEVQLYHLLANYGFSYNVAYENKTYRQWLTEIKNKIARQSVPKTRNPENTRSANATGISGKSSDDRLRRQWSNKRIQRRIRRAFMTMLVVAAIWEIGYRSSRTIHGEANVSRFGGFVSILRQLFGRGTSPPDADLSRQTPRKDISPPKMVRKENKNTVKLAPVSTVELVSRNHALSPSIEQFIFIITLYKRDGWFDTGIPISACDLVDSQIVGDEPDAHILARIADNIKTFQRQENKGSSPSLQVVIFDHAVEAEHVILRNDQVVTLALKLVDNRDKDKVMLRTTLELLYANGGLPETRKREQSLINQFKMTAASH
jgi:hypothetical protein